MDDFPEVLFIANIAVPIIVLPQFTATAKQPVDAPRTETFPIFEQFRLRCLPDFDKQMNMVWHHHPGEQTIIFAIKEHPILFDDLRGSRVAQFALAKSMVEIGLHFRVSREVVIGVQQRCPFMPAAGGHGIMQTVV